MTIDGPIPILEDNTAAIYLSEKANLNNRRTRHMAVRWHWLQQKVMSELIKLHHVRTEFQVADILTKGVDRGTFNRLASILLGHSSLWEFGNKVLRRVLAASNDLSREAMVASSEHAQTVPRLPEANDQESQNVIRPARCDNAEQEQAALMYGAEYSGDVTGDGPAPVHDQEGKDEPLPPDAPSDEKDDGMEDAMIDDAPDSPDPHVGYDDGMLLGYEDESQCMVGHRHNPIDLIGEPADPISVQWPALAVIEELYRPEAGRAPMRGSIDNASLQLISNTMGSCPDAARILLDYSCFEGTQ